MIEWWWLIPAILGTAVLLYVWFMHIISNMFNW